MNPQYSKTLQDFYFDKFLKNSSECNCSARVVKFEKQLIYFAFLYAIGISNDKPFANYL